MHNCSLREQGVDAMFRVSLVGGLIFALLISLCTGILVGDRTSARTNQPQERGRKAAPDLRHRLSNAQAGERVRVVIQPKAGGNDELDSVLRNHGASRESRFHNFAARVVELPASAVANLEAHGDVAYVSLDREMRSLGHVSQTSG